MIKDALDKWIIERSKKCPKCGETNLLNSVYCTACGQISAGETTIVENTIECARCKEKSPEKSKFCRGCGAAIVIE
jgi:ribosomal protein S27AE